MELYADILKHLLMNEKIEVRFPDLKTDSAELVESVCYQILRKIKEIIEDDRLDDEICYLKIEQIICALEEIGSSGGYRHDFG